MMPPIGKQKIVNMEYNIVFMDESGSGSKGLSKVNFWVTVGVLSNLDNHQAVTEDLNSIRKKNMRLYNKELKGTDISRNHLNPGIDKMTVAKDISDLISKYNMSVFVTASNMAPSIKKLESKFTASNTKNGLQAKDVARELLLERISIFLNYKRTKDMLNLLVWDLSDNNELADFSAITGSYVNPHDHKKLNSTVVPHILGGLSHDWAELQIADLISNYALNYVADGIYDDADKDKSEAFKQYLYPVLQHSIKGKVEGIGFKLMFNKN